MPVMRAHFLAGHGTAGELLDCFAVLGSDGFFASAPIRHYGLGDAQESGYGQRPSTLPRDPLRNVHAAIIRHGVSICQ